MFRAVGCALIVSLVSNLGFAQELDPRLNNFDISGLVRFDSPDEAEARRGEMLKLIWPDGITTARPKVTESIDFPPELGTVDKSLVHLAARLGWVIGHDNPIYPVLKITLSQAAPILPYLLLVLILIFRPKGLLGTREG